MLYDLIQMKCGKETVVMTDSLKKSIADCLLSANLIEGNILE